MSRITDLNRTRAIEAFENMKIFLEEIESLDEKDELQKKMKSYCRNLPIMIKKNGLLSVISFIKGKSLNDGKEGKVYRKIYDWLNVSIGRRFNNYSIDIMEKFLKVEDIYEYTMYTKEILEILEWYKKTSEAMIEKSEIKL